MAQQEYHPRSNSEGDFLYKQARWLAGIVGGITLAGIGVAAAIGAAVEVLDHIDDLPSPFDDMLE